MTRKRNLAEETNECRRKRTFGKPTDTGPAGRGTKRIDGPNGSWPAQRASLGGGKRAGKHVNAAAPPRPPAICFLYEDLTDIEELERAVPMPIFGQYPALFIARIMPWLRCRPREVLHVCSGALPSGQGIRIDIRQSASPDVVADGRALPIRSSSVAGVMLDPPYTEHYAKDLYGTGYPRPAHLLREAARVVRPGGRIVFVHYITPNPPPGCRYLKCFGLSTGMGFPMRAVTIFERGQDDLPGMVE